MKMFTKLIGSVMMLLLLSAVVLQAQDNQIGNKVKASDDLIEGIIPSQDQQTETIDLSKIATYGGPTDAVIYNNGPFVTNPGGGAGGADLSALQVSLGMNTLGANFNHAILAGEYYYMGDDFTIVGEVWTMNFMKFFGYQTGSTTTSTFTGVYVQIWNGDPSLPASSVVFGDLVTNRLTSTAWTNCYRASDATPTLTTRPIMEIVADMTGCVLPPGTYWVQVGATGSLASGPWAPPISILGSPVTGDAKQKTTAGAAGWVNWLDTGTGTPAQGLPFIIDGTAAPLTCPDPTGLGVTGLTTTSGNLTWTSNSGLSDIEFGLAGFAPTGVPTDVGKTSPYTKTPLAPGTSYSFYVRDNCGGSGYSLWVGPYTFSTLCAACPGGSIPEGEPQLVNGSTLAGINGGCAVGDPLLTSPIALGQTYCGQSNSFINDLSAAARDNDYYYLDLTTPANIYWNIDITIQGNALFNVTFFDAGDMTCAIGAVAAITTTSGCEVGNINVDVPSGNYYVVARVATAAGNLWPAGSGPWQYVLSVTGSQVGAPNLNPDPPLAIEKTLPLGGTGNEILVIGNSGTYQLDYTLSTSGSYNSVVFDNFDSYTAGLQLAGQSGGAWTTWGGTSGGADDGFVTSAQSFSAPNSFVVTPNIDQVKLFGDLSSGVYKLSFMNYITAGKAGYFNILSDFTFGTGGYWAVDMYFDAVGTIRVVANHTTITAGFNWTPDAWKKVEILVDLDNDVAEAIYDGVSIYTWPWSEGGSTGTGTLIIDAIDFYGATVDDEMYVDNFMLEVAGNDWLTINGGLGTGGSIAVGGPSVNVTLGFDATGKPIGVYNKIINLTTNELGAKTAYAIPVTMYVGFGVSGYVYYGVTGATKPMATNTTVTLTPGPTVPTGAGGAYTIRPVADGTYALTGATTKAWGGLQAFDATLIARYLGSIITLTNLQKRAADVNLSSTISAFDGTLIKRRLGSIATPQWTAPNYVFDGPYPSTPVLIGMPVTIAGAYVIQDLRTLCSGDLNSSYTPPAE